MYSMYSAFNTLSESYFYILKLQNRSFVTNFARRAEKEYLFFLFQRGSPAECSKNKYQFS